MGYGVGEQRSNQSCPHQLHDSWTYEVRTRSPFRHNRSAYKVADVFTIEELKSLCAPSATTIIESGQNVLTW